MRAKHLPEHLAKMAPGDPHGPDGESDHGAVSKQEGDPHGVSFLAAQSDRKADACHDIERGLSDEVEGPDAEEDVEFAQESESEDGGHDAVTKASEVTG